MKNRLGFYHENLLFFSDTAGYVYKVDNTTVISQPGPASAPPNIYPEVYRV